MADNFDMKQFLTENKLGPYSRVKEDIGGDIGDAEAEKMMDFLAEKDKVDEVVDKSTLGKVEQALDMLSSLKSNTSTNSNIPTTDKQGLVYAFQEMEDILEDVAADIEQEYEEKEADSFYDEDKPVSDYSRRRASELNEDDKYDIDAKSFGGIMKSDNPEGDALVLRFLQGIAKKFDYPVSQAALFVKERIKKLGY